MYEVSVVVPVYNSGRNLINNINSLLSQYLKNIEIIIVNDASIDDTALIINELERKYSNIKSIHLPVNVGVYEARKIGIQHSTSLWIGFMDADDFVRPNMFSKMLKVAKNENVDVVVCGIDRVNHERNFISNAFSCKNDELITNNVFEKFCKDEFSVVLWNKLYRRDVIIRNIAVEFPWRQDLNEDLISNIGIFKYVERVYLLKDVLYDYVKNENSITENTSRVKAFVEHFRAYALAINSYAKIDDEMAIIIAEIYRISLANYSYSLSSLDTLLDHKEKLLEAVELLLQANPLALALIATSPRPIALGRKEMIKYLAKSLIK